MHSVRGMHKASDRSEKKLGNIALSVNNNVPSKRKSTEEATNHFEADCSHTKNVPIYALLWYAEMKQKSVKKA